MPRIVECFSSWPKQEAEQVQLMRYPRRVEPSLTEVHLRLLIEAVPSSLVSRLCEVYEGRARGVGAYSGETL